LEGYADLFQTWNWKAGARKTGWRKVIQEVMAQTTRQSTNETESLTSVQSGWVFKLLVPPDFGGASKKCQGEFQNFVTPWGKKI
jgi:hypothetical protein